MNRVTKEDLARAFRAIGLARGDRLLVHSSLKSLGRVDGGAEAVIEALFEVLGKTGTLLMPTFTGSSRDSIKHPPVFDVRNTPCWTGLIPETFRKREGVRRSLHPTHSVAGCGPATVAYLRDHETSPTPCGWETPFGRLIRDRGRVLFIGATLESCTLFHSFEELAGVEYHMLKEPVECTVARNDGSRVRVTVGLHWWNPDARRDFEAVERVLMRAGVLRWGRAGAATLRLMEAGETHAIVMDLLKRDPTALLARRRIDLE